MTPRRSLRPNAVTFDFWGTLARDSPEALEIHRTLRIRALLDGIRRTGAALPESDVAAGYERSGALIRERFWLRHRDLSLRVQVELALECCLPDVVARMAADVFEATVEAYVAPTLLHPPALVPGAEHAVRALAERGVILAVVSNTGRTPGVVLRRILERHGLLALFAATSHSDETGCRKPDEEMFRLTLERAGADRARAAHVGDDPVDDVMGARRAGMLAVHYTGPNGSPSADADLAVADLSELPERLFRGAS